MNVTNVCQKAFQMDFRLGYGPNGVGVSNLQKMILSALIFIGIDFQNIKNLLYAVNSP
jgi:hypothetical protein